MSGAKSVPILEVVRRYSGIELKQKGREYWGLCPLHNERTPSFAVNIQKNVWNCYGGCGGGSGIDFLMKLRGGISFKEACATIESDFGIVRDEWQQPAKTIEQTKASLISALDRKIDEVFNYCFAGRLAVLAELKRHDEAPGQMVSDLGLFEIVMEEIASGEPARVITALNLFERRKADGKHVGGGNH